MPAESEIAENTQVKITIGGEEAIYDLTEFTLTENGYRVIVHISAAQMTGELSYKTLNITSNTGLECKLLKRREEKDEQNNK